MLFTPRFLFTTLVLLGFSSLGLSSQALAQQGQRVQRILGQDDAQRVITTGVPFLAISPDARSAGMGDVGVATSPDANSVHWNPAKLAFLETDLGASLSYTPWLNNIVDDMFISYLSGYKKIADGQTLALNLRYFNLGDIQLTDNQGNPLNRISPREFTFGATYALKFSEKLSGGVSARFIHSNLLVDAGTNGTGKPGVSAGADVSVYYNSPIVLGAKEGTWSFGANISNIGPKITYQSDSTADFLPTNLRLGTAITTNLDPFNKLTLALDFNKLMVPTPLVDTVTGRINPRNNKTLISGMFSSFSDAPGGFEEELREVMISAGIEYWYNDLFAVRTGYFHESLYKGARRYFTAGLGLRYQVFGVDFAYLLPRGKDHPLQETLRITLHFTMADAEQPEIEPDR